MKILLKITSFLLDHLNPSTKRRNSARTYTYIAMMIKFLKFYKIRSRKKRAGKNSVPRRKGGGTQTAEDRKKRREVLAGGGIRNVFTRAGGLKQRFYSWRRTCRVYSGNTLDGLPVGCRNCEVAKNIDHLYTMGF